MRTYSEATFIRATALWSGGEFGPEWTEVRRISWERGFPFPPTGSKHDSREDESPSQRSIVWAALLDRPRDTTAIVRRSRSWGDVVSAIFGTEARLREKAGLEELTTRTERVGRPSRRAAMASLAQILDGIRGHGR